MQITSVRVVYSRILNPMLLSILLMKEWDQNLILGPKLRKKIRLLGIKAAAISIKKYTNISKEKKKLKFKTIQTK